MKLVIVHGTNRKESRSLAVAKWIASRTKNDSVSEYFGQSVQVELVSVADLVVSNDGTDESSRDQSYVELVRTASAFIFVVPEYNHSFPGSFKTAFDTAFLEYERKPVLFAGVSTGTFGGVRAIEALLGPARAVGLVTMKRDLFFPNIASKISETGGFVPDDQDEKRLSSQLETLGWFAQKLM